MSGWIKLHRDLVKHWIYSFDEPDKALAWIDLIMLARHESGEILLKGRVQRVSRGQVAMSQLALQKRWRWSQNKVKRFLKLLKNERMIDFQANDLTTIISICKYEEYQERERTDGRPLGRTDGRPVERATDDQTNDDIRIKEGKEGKKGKNILSAQDADEPKKRKKIQQSPEDLETATFIWLHVDGLAPGQKAPKIEDWANDVRLMRERDGRSDEDIRDVFLFAHNDQFWRQNIKSPGKLRKQFDALNIQRIQAHKVNGHKGNGASRITDDFSNKTYTGTPENEITWLND